MRTAFVTGGSRGIGAAVVRDLTKKGFKVIFNYVSDDLAADALAKEVGAYPLKCDVTNGDLLAEKLHAAEKLCGRVSVLVAAAGIAPKSKLFTDFSVDEINRVFDVNVNGVFNAVRAVIGGMVERGYGRIVLLSSVWGEVGGSCETVYSATKGAISAYTKALAKEVGLSGITVNAVAPGLIDTDMNSALSEKDRKEFAETLALGRVGTPDEVASLIGFLADESSAYISGQIIKIDGGM